MKLTPREEGGLNPMYWPGIDAAFGPATTLARDGRSMSDAAFMVTATVEWKEAKAAGIAFGHHLALLDSAGKVSLVDVATSKPLQDRRWAINSAGTYKLRLVVVNGMVDVYVDDVLVIDCYLAEVGDGGVSLVSREGTCRFIDASYRAVKATSNRKRHVATEPASAGPRGRSSQRTGA